MAGGGRGSKSLTIRPPGSRRRVFATAVKKNSDLLRCARVQRPEILLYQLAKNPLKVQDRTAGRILPFAGGEGGLLSDEISNEPK